MEPAAYQAEKARLKKIRDDYEKALQLAMEYGAGPAKIQPLKNHLYAARLNLRTFITTHCGESPQRYKYWFRCKEYNTTATIFANNAGVAELKARKIMDKHWPPAQGRPPVWNMELVKMELA